VVSGNAFWLGTKHWKEFCKYEQGLDQSLNGALDILSKPFPGHESLPPKERVALAQIIRGASSKEAGRTLGVSPRTVDFHRANLLKKARRPERRRARA
jgi:DNA-binding CsgD family transcriptional regulator